MGIFETKCNLLWKHNPIEAFVYSPDKAISGLCVIPTKHLSPIFHTARFAVLMHFHKPQNGKSLHLLSQFQIVRCSVLMPKKKPPADQIYPAHIHHTSSFISTYTLRDARQIEHFQIAVPCSTPLKCNVKYSWEMNISFACAVLLECFLYSTLVSTPQTGMLWSVTQKVFHVSPPLPVFL